MKNHECWTKPTPQPSTLVDVDTITNDSGVLDDFPGVLPMDDWPGFIDSWPGY